MAAPLLLFFAGNLLRAASQAVAKQLIKQGAKKATQTQIKNNTPKVISKVSDVEKTISNLRFQNLVGLKPKPPSSKVGKNDIFGTRFKKPEAPKIKDKPKLDKPKKVEKTPPKLFEGPKKPVRTKGSAGARDRKETKTVTKPTPVKKPVRTKGSAAARDRRNLTILGLTGGGFGVALERYLNDKSLPFLPPSTEKEIKKVLRSTGSDEAKDRAEIKSIIKDLKKPIRSQGSEGARDRKETKTAKPPKRESSVKDVAPLGGSSYEIKKGDTLSAIARRKNTTVAALMRMNPKIKDKDKIRAGQFIKVGSPEKAKAKTKSAKDLRGKPTSVAEAKRRGMDSYFVINSKGEEVEKAAVTASELKKSGLTLRQYLNKKKKRK